MIGEVFCCPGCHRWLAGQVGFLTQMLATMGHGVSPVPIAPGDQRHLTNGTWYTTAPLVFCASCLPAGAVAVPLAELGVRP